VARDPIVDGALTLAARWEKEAEDRERRTPGVPDAAIATLRTNASELRAHLEQIERETAYLTVTDYAKLTGASDSTIRRLCAQGLIEGAERDVRNEWRIPRGAKRRAVAS
jgi:excisionase family DNA binding protein